MDSLKTHSDQAALNLIAPAEDVLVQGVDFTLLDEEDDPADYAVPGNGAKGFSVDTDAAVEISTPRSAVQDPAETRVIPAKAGRRYDVRVLAVIAAGTTATDLQLYL